MSVYRVIVTVLLSLAGGIEAGAEQLPQIRVPPSLFRDQLNPRLPTAGGELLGLMGGDPVAQITGPILVIGGIDERDAIICVTIRQVSGAYSASFQIPNPRVGPTVGFLLPPQKIRVEQLQAAELSILARAAAGQSCARDSAVLPAAWNKLNSSTLFALVNNHQADRTRTMAPRGANDCERLGSLLPGRALTSYQMACRFVLQSTDCKPAPLAIELQNAGEVSFIRASVRHNCQ